MPGSGGRFGVNEPPPAAITTTLRFDSVPASVVSAEAAVEPLERLHPLVEVELGAERLDLLQQLVGQLLAR